MYHLTDLTFDAHRAEMQYRTAKLAGMRRIRMAPQRHWWQRTAVMAAHSTTN